MNDNRPTRLCGRRSPRDVGISITSSVRATVKEAGTRYSGSTGKYDSGGNVARWSAGMGESDDRCMNWSFSVRQPLMLSTYGTSFAVQAIVVATSRTTHAL